MTYYWWALPNRVTLLSRLRRGGTGGGATASEVTAPSVLAAAVVTGSAERVLDNAGGSE